MAAFELGDVIDSIGLLQLASAEARDCPTTQQFAVAFDLYTREAEWLSPKEALPGLARLRQLASAVGDAPSLSKLHLAVSSLEGFRGALLDARRHLEIARRLAHHTCDEGLLCGVALTGASLETMAGNLEVAGNLAADCLRRAQLQGFQRYDTGAAANLALLAVHLGDSDAARTRIRSVLEASRQIFDVQLAGLDNLAQLELHEGHLQSCSQVLGEYASLARTARAPARSWNDLSNDITRCAYHERLEDWETVVQIVDEADPELVRRQFQVLRTLLLGARARALAALGRHKAADASLATAVRTCPRGAVEPLIVLEASRAVCAGHRGCTSDALRHADRAVAACRAIGHRYHEAWITRARQALERVHSASTNASTTSRIFDLTDTALLVGDVAVVLGAGHSIELLAQRTLAILEATPLAPRVQVSRHAADDHAEPSATWDTTAEGEFVLRLQGAGADIAICVSGPTSIDDLALLKALADVVRAAIVWATWAGTDDEDQELWPRDMPLSRDDAIFQSPRMVEVLGIARRFATTGLPILITGETGTGKEILARLIHEHSKVSRGPFVPFNCSTVARELAESQLFGHRRGAFTGATDTVAGLIRSAEGGTLFLDEVGDLDPSVQPKLLRWLETGEVQPVGEARPRRTSVRLIFATNATLEAAVDDGRFRADLFYRLNVTRIALPPLRERKDEIPALARLFLQRAERECGRTNVRLGDDFMAALLLFDWPGNVRQLANEIRRAVAMAEDGQTLDSSHLAPDVLRVWNSRPIVEPAGQAPTVRVRLDQPLGKAIEELEHRFIDHALANAGGRVAEAARLLGLSRKGLFLKRRRRGLVPSGGQRQN